MVHPPKRRTGAARTETRSGHRAPVGSRSNPGKHFSDVQTCAELAPAQHVLNSLQHNMCWICSSTTSGLRCCCSCSVNLTDLLLSPCRPCWRLRNSRDLRLLLFLIHRLIPRDSPARALPAAQLPRTRRVRRRAGARVSHCLGGHRCWQRHPVLSRLTLAAAAAVAVAVAVPGLHVGVHDLLDVCRRRQALRRTSTGVATMATSVPGCVHVWTTSVQRSKSQAAQTIPKHHTRCSSPTAGAPLFTVNAALQMAGSGMSQVIRQ